MAGVTQEMKVRIEAGRSVLHAEGTVQEVAELAREIAGHSNPDISVEAESARSLPDTLAPSLDALMVKVRRVPQHQIEQWVRANPKGSTHAMLRELAGIGSYPRFVPP